jgi:hypothetical protein
MGEVSSAEIWLTEFENQALPRPLAKSGILCTSLACKGGE